MLCMAFLMAASAILAGFFSARVGAGIGKELRGKMYEKVMSFSDAEMNRFSTASLITRSTNDIQQIQMVETMVLDCLLSVHLEEKRKKKNVLTMPMLH